MKQLILFILLLSLISCAIKQKDNENNSFEAFNPKNLEIKLVKFRASECQTDLNIYKINNRIVSFEKYGDTTVIEISIKANCCISRKPKIRQCSDTIDLIFDYEEPEYIEDECECECCYNFKYFLLGLEDKSYIYRADNSVINFSKHKYKIVQEPKFSIIDGDTLNYVDIYGMKQGIHRFYDKLNREKMSLIYVDDYPTSGLALRIYSENGNVESEAYLTKGNKYKIFLFDLDGNVIKECISKSVFGSCKD